MDKATRVILVLIIFVLILLIVDEYNRQFENKLADVKQVNAELKARIDENRAVLERIQNEVIRSKVALNEQAFIMNQNNFDFVIENKELFEGWSNAPSD